MPGDHRRAVPGQPSAAAPHPAAADTRSPPGGQRDHPTAGLATSTASWGELRTLQAANRHLSAPAELELLIEAAIYPDVAANAAVMPGSMPVGGHGNPALAHFP
jgi:hypothetical protein